MLFDLASLTKPMATAPLALEYLELDRDWRMELGFRDWHGPITPRLLLSHSAGLPPWLPCTGEPLFEQISNFDAWGRHSLLKRAAWGESTYSDLSYRLLAEILEIETGRDWKDLGENLTGLKCAPWKENPVFMPPGADLEAWKIATAEPFPEPKPEKPHDANARAGMKGHAGFAANPESAQKWLGKWIKKYLPSMAHETCRSQEGEIWGLGLQRLRDGSGGFAMLLNGKDIQGVHIVSDAGFAPPPQVQPFDLTDPSDWWFHYGYTGPALFVEPNKGACVLILCHRLNDASRLLTVDELRARRLQILEDFLRKMSYSHSTLKKLNRAVRVGCAESVVSRRQAGSETKSADVTLIL
ncbi:MAG: beta-lactamase family protein [Holophagales bacterium]|jgi:CubicO group peptidase (beta-lactamase class C family)|nr:beta-lactamase family protein [Holophagales bacterium]